MPVDETPSEGESVVAAEDGDVASVEQAASVTAVRPKVRVRAMFMVPLGRDER